MLLSKKPFVSFIKTNGAKDKKSLATKLVEGSVLSECLRYRRLGG